MLDIFREIRDDIYSTDLALMAHTNGRDILAINIEGFSYGSYYLSRKQSNQ
jgi:hypothetical protein